MISDSGNDGLLCDYDTTEHKIPWTEHGCSVDTAWMLRGHSVVRCATIHRNSQRNLQGNFLKFCLIGVSYLWRVPWLQTCPYLWTEHFKADSSWIEAPTVALQEWHQTYVALQVIFGLVEVKMHTRAAFVQPHGFCRWALQYRHYCGSIIVTAFCSRRHHPHGYSFGAAPVIPYWVLTATQFNHQERYVALICGRRKLQ